MPETKPLLPTPSEFLRAHLTWVLGISPFVVAAFNVSIISGGDPEVFAYLLQNLSLVPLVLGVTLPLIPPAIVLILLRWLGQRTAIPKDERAKLPRYFWPIVISFLILIFMVMQISWVLLTGSLLIVFYLAQQATKDENRRSQLRYGVDVELEPFRGFGWSWLPAVLAVLGIAGFLASTSAWIPNEIIHLKDRAPVSGQVLSSDQEWTTLLDKHGHVQIARTQDITSREPCYKDTSLGGKTLGNLISKHIYTKGTSDLRCPS